MTLSEEGFMMIAQALEKMRGGAYDDAVEELVEEGIKRIQADVNALMFEVSECEAALVNATSELEAKRIRDAQPVVSWGTRQDDWRGQDFYEGPAE
jgi:hypothetical protein